MAEDRPEVDDRDPATVVVAMVDHVLELAATWPRWDGVPSCVDDRLYTPNKAIRRVSDHLIDQLEPALAERVLDIVVNEAPGMGFGIEPCGEVGPEATAMELLLDLCGRCVQPASA